METVTIISLVASVVQFVDYGTKLIKTAKEIRESNTGRSRETTSLENVTTEMYRLSSSLDSPTTEPQTEDERALLRLAQECRGLSEQILKLIHDMTSVTSRSWPKIGFLVLKAWRYKDEINELEQKLGIRRSQLLIHYNRVTSLDAKKRLIDLVDKVDTGSIALATLDKRNEELQRGITVKSLSKDAQEQLRNLFNITNAARERIAQHQIRKCLAFRDMHERYDIVDPAHCGTFRWLLEEDTARGSSSIREARDKFLGWLSYGTRIFHIEGKLGSGKSTLMKFICRHPRTKKELLVWAGQFKLVIVSFFFWKPGSRLQKSFAGLLRSLLHDVVAKCPELAHLVFPDAWDRVLSSEIPHVSDIRLSDEDVLRAFDTFLKQCDIAKTYRFCFFIDALDEFEDTHRKEYRDLVNELNSWVSASSGAVKLCVSSREYNTFQAGFSAELRIRLQDLTKVDMLRYTQNRLEEIPDFERSESLAQKIVVRSDGIFLWVVLVVKALREALEDGRDPVTFQAELESLPRELNALFEHLLKSIPENQLKRAYQIIAMVIEHESYSTKLSLLSPLYLDAYEENPQFALRENFLLSPPDSDDIKVLQSWHKIQQAKAQKLVQGYCKGLVEVRNNPTNDEKRDRSSPELPAVFRCILFTHRTILELFRRTNVEKAIVAKLDGFDTIEAISQLHLAEIRSMHCILIDESHWSKTFSNVLAMRFRMHKDDAPYSYLTCLESAVREKFASRWNDDKEITRGPLRCHRNPIATLFCSVAKLQLRRPIAASAWLGDARYVHWALQREPSLMNNIQVSTLLFRCLCHRLFQRLESLDLEIVQQCFEILLQQGLPQEASHVWPGLVAQYARHMRYGVDNPVDFTIMGRWVELFLTKSGKTNLHSVCLRMGTKTRNIYAMMGDTIHLEATKDDYGGCASEDEWESPTMRMLAQRAPDVVWLEDLVDFWDFPNKDEIIKLIIKGYEDCGDFDLRDETWVGYEEYQ